MARGDDSLRTQLEADMARVLDAMHALSDLQEWSLTLARRRWRVADGEEFQGYVHRLELGLMVVHRWMRMLRKTLPTLRIAGLLGYNRTEEEPPKEDSESAAR